MEWIELAPDRDRWWAVVKAVIKLQGILDFKFSPCLEYCMSSFG
jgi:hypothetical protein